MRRTLMQKPYSSHPDDHYLSIVLCEIDNTLTPYVVWLKNSDCGGYYDGFYAESLDKAVENFNKRGV